MNDIIIKCSRIKKNITKWTKKLAELQMSCPHSNTITTYHGSTGNFDPIDDGYYKKHHCQDCGHRWCDE